jgi:hypothetical protein
MYVKKIKYTNYNGEERERRFYFNLSKAEVLNMELSTNGGYENYINRIVETRDQHELIRMFKELIKMSYGVKSDDGEMFIKNDKVFSEFEQSEAYSEFYMELVTNTESAIEFINGIMPQALMAEVQKDPQYKEKIDEYKKLAVNAGVKPIQ